MHLYEAVNKAIEAHQSGHLDQAAAIYDSILTQLDKPNFEVIAGYGSILVAQEKFGLGIALLNTAISINPNHPLAWTNLGVALKFLGKDEQAIKAYEKAYALNPSMPEVLAGIAGYWVGKDDPKKVEEFSRRAVSIEPDFPAGRMHLGMALLEQGRFAEAWPHYEYRWETPERSRDKRPYKAPKWNGETVDVLAIHGEQGLGDEIMFLSLLSEARKRVGAVVIECAERLIPTFKASFNVPCYPDHASLIKAEGEPDAYISMGSLPKLLGLPDGKPYLRRRARKVGGRPRIGIAWKGGTARTGGSDRSLSLSALAPILNSVDATFVSVQYGDESVDVEATGYGLETGPRDFDSLHTRIAGCDMVITVCQTALHQAGAMGIPCVVLTPRKAPWVACNEACPWYESVEFIRQQVDGDWSHPIAETVALLKDKYRAAA